MYIWSFFLQRWHIFKSVNIFTSCSFIASITYLQVNYPTRQSEDFQFCRNIGPSPQVHLTPKNPWTLHSRKSTEPWKLESRVGHPGTWWLDDEVASSLGLLTASCMLQTTCLSSLQSGAANRSRPTSQQVKLLSQPKYRKNGLHLTYSSQMQRKNCNPPLNNFSDAQWEGDLSIHLLSEASSAHWPKWYLGTLHQLRNTRFLETPLGHSQRWPCTGS